LKNPPKELDAPKNRILRHSLGGITATVFCGVLKAVWEKVPIVALAGGQCEFCWVRKESPLAKEAKNFVSIIEPLNFVITTLLPRPFPLMLNCKKKWNE